MRRFQWIVAVVLAICSIKAQAFIDLPVVIPGEPTTETPIVISIRNGLCDGILSHSISNPSNPMDIVIRRIPTQMDPFCIVPIHDAEIPIGILPAGTHQIRLFFQIREFIGEPPNEPYLWQELSIAVAPGAGEIVAPVPVSTMQDWLPIGMLAILVLFAVLRVRSARLFFFTGTAGLLLTGYSAPSTAQTVTHAEALLSIDSNAPTPDDVVAWAASPPERKPAPLEALDAEPLLAVDYFVPERFRARGDFKAILDAHPDSPQALLERYVVVTYPDGVDLENALDAYSADPFVVTAAVMETYEFNGVTLQSFGFKDDLPSSSTQADQWQHAARLCLSAGGHR